MLIQINEDAAALMGISSKPSTIALLIAAIDIAIALPLPSANEVKECNLIGVQGSLRR